MTVYTVSIDQMSNTYKTLKKVLYILQQLRGEVLSQGNVNLKYEKPLDQSNWNERGKIYIHMSKPLICAYKPTQSRTINNLKLLALQ